MTHISNFLAANKLWVLLSIGAVFNFFWITQFNKKLRINSIVAAVLSILHMVFSVIFVKIFAFIEGVPGGMSLYGCFFFLPVLFFLIALLTKRNIADVFDAFTVPTLVIAFFGRANCLFSGCCLGNIIPGTENVRWPTREAELVLYIVLYIFFRRRVKNVKFRGLMYPIFIMVYGTFRFIVEWLREGDSIILIFHISHFWSLLSVFIGGIICYSAYHFRKKSKEAVRGGK